MQEQLMKLKETAKYLNISEHHLRKLVKEDKVPHIPLGKAIRFNPEVIRDFVVPKEG